MCAKPVSSKIETNIVESHSLSRFEQKPQVITNRTPSVKDQGPKTRKYVRTYQDCNPQAKPGRKKNFLKSKNKLYNKIQKHHIKTKTKKQKHENKQDMKQSTWPPHVLTKKNISRLSRPIASLMEATTFLVA